MSLLVTSLGFLVEYCLGLKRENLVRWKLWSRFSKNVSSPFHIPCNCTQPFYIPCDYTHPFQIHVTVLTHLKCKYFSIVPHFSIEARFVSQPRTGWCGTTGLATQPALGFLCLCLLRLELQVSCHAHLPIYYLPGSWQGGGGIQTPVLLLACMVSTLTSEPSP